MIAKGNQITLYLARGAFRPSASGLSTQFDDPPLSVRRVVDVSLCHAEGGVTGEVLLQILETRLDNVAFRMGFTLSRAAARQLVRHRHFTVNGRVVDIPSYAVRPGDMVGVREGSRQVPSIVQAVEKAKSRSQAPDWLSFDADSFSGRLLQKPSRDGVSLPVQEQLIVELYSK